MPECRNLLGVDIGSVSISLAEIDPTPTLLRSAYTFHRGRPRRCLHKLLRNFDLTSIGGLAITASSSSFLGFEHRYDDRLCLMAACRLLHGKAGAILEVGGEKFGLIRFDSLGNYLSFTGSSSCAAGTGSFLDQQARRLKLEGIQSLSSMASRNSGKRPQIATRCAVFAKTDLAHAQQEGFSLGEICDGLCYGLAQNIVDTVLSESRPLDPVVFVGGVSLNGAVVSHLEDLLGQKLVVDGTAIHGALGAALLRHQELPPASRHRVDSKKVFFSSVPSNREYYYPPLRLETSEFPDFRSRNRYLFTGSENRNNPVEVDCYESPGDTPKLTVYLGIDIGSTSTKAVLLDSEGRVLAGFYTRTAGRPLGAARSILAAIVDLGRRHRIEFHFLGVGTTGSGRKFVGEVIGADLVLNEISAHARAAVHLNPAVDTIIEIGGQDSKFTVLRDGVVTFSVMNTVCAAGTGSFIEEQAEKLGCPLEEIAGKTEGQRAPLASDRCTVFMERDINHYLSQGYTVGEVLASVLHSVRENYLSRVAVESQMGKVILFQGATARNRSLIAAFEQRLRKPIQVSKFCHLTGAFGVALVLADRAVSLTRFRGLNLHRRPIPLQSEVCLLCTNHCKISIAEVEGEKVAYGFLCGRDYETRKYVDNNRSGFDLLEVRRKACAFRKQPTRHPGVTIAMPAGLHLQEDLFFWQRFFNELGLHTITSETCRNPVQRGKHLLGAEFCAPITALLGHTSYLLETQNEKHAPYIFVPFYLDQKPERKGTRRQYCYYTQFAPALAALGSAERARERLLTPLVHYLYHSFHTKAELYRVLSGITHRKIGFLEVSSAYDKALEFKAQCSRSLKEAYRREVEATEGFHVVLLGRPYAVLADSMNKKIPRIFASLGIKVFYQDMLTLPEESGSPLRDLLTEVPWYFSSQILRAAEEVARRQGAYPVLVTSFKCTPDAYTVEYYRQILESHGKPYLVLELDEHDSSVGYETRIEAAVESFRNHFKSDPTSGRSMSAACYPSVLCPSRESDLRDKVLLLPNWDNLTIPLVVANLRREGIDARTQQGGPATIRQSLQKNTGQCTPLTIIAEEYIDYVRRHDLDPGRTLLWIGGSSISCNISMFPHHVQNLIRAGGGSLRRAKVYVGDLSFADVSFRLPVPVYFAFMFGGFLRKMACHIRPHECLPGSTDHVVREGLRVFETAFLAGTPRVEAVEKVVSLFRAIKTAYRPKPKVAIFGDFYVRDNETVNQDLIRFIEQQGGEVVTTPYSAFVQMVSRPYLRKWVIEGRLLEALSSKALLAAVSRFERAYLRHFQTILGDWEPPYADPPETILARYNVRVEHTGESMENLLKVYYIKKHHPDLALFVQSSPAFCCPSLVTEAMAREIERNTGVPVVSITYDGTAGSKNEAVIPYLKFPRAREPAGSLRVLS